MNNIEKLLATFLEPLQELRNVYYDLLVNRRLDTAGGVQLRTIGKIVGQPWAGEDDDLYRRYIRARVRVNRSSGTIPELNKIARLIVGDDATIQIQTRNYYPAAIRIRIYNMEVDADLADLLLKMLSQAVSGGVRLIVETSAVLAAEAFSFANGPGLGFGAGAFTRAQANS